MDLTDIHDPAFLKQLDQRQLKALAQQIREFLIDHVSKTGGHLSSNLGVVELTIALHKVFDSPQDKIFFDVGHQCYTHKILPAGPASLIRFVSMRGCPAFRNELKVSMTSGRRDIPRPRCQRR